MSSHPEKLDSELESFRRQWLSDLKGSKVESSTAHAPPQAQASSSRQRKQPRQSHAPHPPPSTRQTAPAEEDDEGLKARVFDEPVLKSGHTLDDPPRGSSGERLLVSALDHYEKAMEKEASGNMGDSLKLYRKAYKLDHRVDRRYREKHFPQAGTTNTIPHIAPPAPSQPPTTTQKSIPTPTKDNPATDQVLSIGELITSFSDLKIEPAPPAVEGSPPPPCPVSDLPEELLVHILQDVAIADVGDFVRLSLVCKQFAYLVATEERTWRCVCEGGEFGFGAIPLHWQKTVEWGALEEEEEEDSDGAIVSPRELSEIRQTKANAVTQSLVPSLYPTWKAMFRSRPRIRFNGCYISTVNYVRAGQASTNQSTWGHNPIHIVTYYRYLRFFRDGTAISLLTTSEPGDIVHHLTRDLLELHRQGPHAHLPSAAMVNALRGRWRLSSAADQPDAPLQDQEGDLFVETEGVGPKYMYRMHMSLSSAGKGARNNKIIWRDFHSYNKLTDDWAQFTLKNDKPFFFSRVKSYGVGE